MSLGYSRLERNQMYLHILISASADILTFVKHVFTTK